MRIRVAALVARPTRGARAPIGERFAPFRPTQPVPASILASHITELRTALDDGLTQLGLPMIHYTDTTITPNVTPIKTAHITGLRGGVL